MKIISALIVAITLMMAPVQKSHAGAGLALSAPAIIAVGGLVSVTSGVVVLDGLVDLGIMSNLKMCRDGGGLGCAFMWLITTVIILPVGLLVLNENGSINFNEIESIKGATDEEVAIYNSELDQLNAVNQTIVEEISRNPKLDEKVLWQDYAQVLEPATLKVAGLNAQALLKQLKK